MTKVARSAVHHPPHPPASTEATAHTTHTSTVGDATTAGGAAHPTTTTTPGSSAAGGTAAPQATQGRTTELQLGGQLREAQLRAETPATTPRPEGRYTRPLGEQQLVGEHRIAGHVVTPSSRSPIPAEQWDRPSTIASMLTQNTAETPNGTARCGPSALLGGAIMNGPEATASVIQGAANGASTLTGSERTELRDIAGRVRDRTASYHDLSRAQDLMHRSGDTRREIGPELAERVAELQRQHDAPDASALTRTTTEATMRRLSEINGRAGRGEATPEDVRMLGDLLSQQTPEGAHLALVPNPRDPTRRELMWEVGTEGRRSDSGIDDGELSALARRSFGWQQTRDPHDIGTRPLETMVFGHGPDALRPGQSATVSVPGRPGDPAAHYITVGRDRDGNAFIYNPDPFTGDHTLVTGDHSVRRALSRYEDRREGLALDATGRSPQVVITNPGSLAH